MESLLRHVLQPLATRLPNSASLDTMDTVMMGHGNDGLARSATKRQMLTHNLMVQITPRA